MWENWKLVIKWKKVSESIFGFYLVPYVLRWITLYVDHCIISRLVIDDYFRTDDEGMTYKSYNFSNALVQSSFRTPLTGLVFINSGLN